jgi:hypothetical protein
MPTPLARSAIGALCATALGCAPRSEKLDVVGQVGVALEGSGFNIRLGQKHFFWSDDSALDMHSIRRGSIPCGAFF